MKYKIEKENRLTKVMEASALTADQAPAINDDRALMEALGFTDEAAADYLGKSRQALNNGLGSKKAGATRDDYFRIGEIGQLVSGAFVRAHDFDRAQVLAYLERTRSPARGKANDRGPWDTIVEQLDPASTLDLSHAKLVVFVVPDFTFMQQNWPVGAETFRDLWQNKTVSGSAPELIILSTSRVQAGAAKSWIAGRESNSVSSAHHEAVDHYLPMVLVYGPGQREAFWLAADAQFVGAPMYRSPLMSQCLLTMMPKDLYDRVGAIIACSDPDNKTNKPVSKTAGA